MIIAAVADIHSPQYYDQFMTSVENMKVTPDLFVIAGDMINRGDVEEFDKVYNVLFGKIYCPIIAVFGNNEFQEMRSRIKVKYPDIKFLDDESIVVPAAKSFVGVVGTTGSLDMPTPWQKKNVPNVEKIYQDRMNFVDVSLEKLMTNFKLVVMHYAPTYKTLEGENPVFYSSMGSQAYERVFAQRKPDLVIHGHSHRGTRRAWIDTTPVFNVALPLNKGIVIIDTDKDLKPGIARFVG
jgi:Icc-related predicted phosphoesterase